MKESNKYFSGELDSNIQYASRERGIKAFAETYSFNIESELFHQLTKEQQKLWRKEIEQACISGGEMGVELAKDPRYKENLEVKEVDLEKEIKNEIDEYWYDNDYGAIQRRGGTVTMEISDVKEIAKHFFELGIKVSNKSIDTTSNIDDLLEEQGIDIYSREAKVIKESFYRAIDNYSSKAQKGE